MINFKRVHTKLLLIIGAFICTVLGLILLNVNTVEPASAASESDLVFTDIGNGYSVKAKEEFNTTGPLNIPSTHNGKPVTKIEDYAFDYSKITSLVIPNSVTDVGEHSFRNCYSLASITIGSGVTELGEWMFANCTGLESVTLPNNITIIGESTFWQCTSLKSITIPNSVTSIEMYAFEGCTSLTKVTIPNSVTSIKPRAFYGCASLDSLVYFGTRVEWEKLQIPSWGTIPSNTKVIYVDLIADIENYGITNNDVNVKYTGQGVLGYYSKGETEYPPNIYFIYMTSFDSDKTFTEEGFYRVITHCTYTKDLVTYFTIDKSAPVIDTYDEYTNSEFTMTAQDKYSDVVAWEYRFNDGEILRHEGESVTLGGKVDNGVWNVRAFDSAGNATEWVTIKYVYREHFGNVDKIYNSFFVPSYYVVTLSQRHYADAYGAYTFEDYDYALQFAIQKEWACRVIVMDGGTSWNYVSASNENTRQIYIDRAEIDTVIDKYARRNISERKIIGKNGAILSNPTDALGVTREDALTQQLKTLPVLLSQYSNCRFMLALQDAYLDTPKSILDGNKVSATIQFISDGFSIRAGSILELKYGTMFKEIVYEQGWYLITEQDLCGNLEKYLIFLDLQEPDIEAQITYGNGNKENIVFNQTYIEENDGAMRYVAFDINAITDNIDEFTMLSISGRSLDAQYLWGDELPILSFENGYYGAYTITVYDRSRNAISFTVYIAGATPTLKNTSLTSETSCTFTVQINDSYNEITDIKLFKVHFDGTEERLFFDSFDTEICAQNLVYKMAVGGKYIFEFTDLYGRTVRTTPIFYMKGLPVATLRGVKDGGLTKNDVTVTFDLDVSAELYAFREGEWVLTELFELSQGVTSKTMKITACPDMTAVFKVLLYVTEDRNLFTEYSFEIDGIPPSVVVLTENGDYVYPDTVTAQGFYLTWEEVGYKVYFKKAGALSDQTYIKGYVINTAGAYEFTVYDSARNELAFMVTLDNVVSYTLDGTYLILNDGSYATRNSFQLTLTEPWSEFNVDASNGLTVLNGQKIDIDGIYIVNVKDLYGNVLTLTLIVDKTPPEPIILTDDGKTISPGARINCAFTVLCEEEDATITLSYGTNYAVYDGALLSDAGTYTFILTDVIGNSREIKVIIDKNVSFKVNGTYVFDENGNYVSKSWLSVALSEDMASFCIMAEDGTKYGAEERITAEGRYELVIRDTSGNELSDLYLIIDKTPPCITLDGVSSGGTTSGTVTVNFSDFDAAYYSLNGGAKLAIPNGQSFVFEGSYIVTASDVVGNTANVSFVVDRTVDVQPNKSIVIGQIVSESISFTFGEPVTALLNKDGVENLYTRGEISEPGEYTLSITDDYDNKKTYSWVIVPQRAREYEINVDGLYVAVTKDGKVYSAVNDNGILRLDETGAYTLQFSGLASNWGLSIEVDRVAPSIEIENTGKSIRISNPNKDGITYTLYLDGAKKAFNLSKMTELTDKGKYRLVCEDEVGNVSEYEFELQYMGTTTIILIVVVCVLVAGGVVAAIIIRFKRKVF